MDDIDRVADNNTTPCQPPKILPGGVSIDDENRTIPDGTDYFLWNAPGKEASGRTQNPTF